MDDAACEEEVGHTARGEEDDVVVDDDEGVRMDRIMVAAAVAEEAHPILRWGKAHTLEEAAAYVTGEALGSAAGAHAEVVVVRIEAAVEECVVDMVDVADVDAMAGEEGECVARLNPFCKVVRAVVHMGGNQLPYRMMKVHAGRLAQMLSERLVQQPEVEAGDSPQKVQRAVDCSWAEVGSSWVQEVDA